MTKKPRKCNSLLFIGVKWCDISPYAFHSLSVVFLFPYFGTLGFSYRICIRANRQWKDIHDEWNYSLHLG